MGVIRLLLAISVLLEHAGPLFGLTLVGGEIAVQCFFAISGFYIAFILEEKYSSNGSGISLFYSNRLLRLMPLYWLVALLVLLKSCFVFIWTDGNSWGHLQSFANYNQEFSFLTWVTLILSNVFVLGQDVLMFTGLDNGELFFTKDFSTSKPVVYSFLLIPQAWTISLELMFYLAAPFLLRWSVWKLLLLVTFSLILRTILYDKGLDFDPWTYRFFPFEVAFFILGAILYRKRKLFVSFFKTTKLESSWVYGLLVLGIVLYSVVSFPFQRIIFTSLFIVSLPILFELSKSWKWDRVMGELSYPVYLVHLLVAATVSSTNILEGSAFSGLVIFLSLLFSFGYNYCIGNKIELYRQNRLAR